MKKTKLTKQEREQLMSFIYKMKQAYDDGDDYTMGYCQGYINALTKDLDADIFLNLHNFIEKIMFDEDKNNIEF